MTEGRVRVRVRPFVKLCDCFSGHKMILKIWEKSNVEGETSVYII